MLSLQYSMARVSKAELHPHQTQFFAFLTH